MPDFDYFGTHSVAAPAAPAPAKAPAPLVRPGWAPPAAFPAYQPQFHGMGQPTKPKRGWAIKTLIGLGVLLAAGVAFPIIQRTFFARHLHLPATVGNFHRLTTPEARVLEDAARRAIGPIGHPVVGVYASGAVPEIFVIGGDEPSDVDTDRELADMAKGFTSTSGVPLAMRDVSTGDGHTLRCGAFRAAVSGTMCGWADSNTGGLVLLLNATPAGGAPIAEQFKVAMGG